MFKKIAVIAIVTLTSVIATHADQDSDLAKREIAKLEAMKKTAKVEKHRMIDNMIRTQKMILSLSEGN